MSIVWPVIIKPVDSSGSEDVFLCQNEAQLARHFNAIYLKNNLLGVCNKEILVQEYLVGDEYVVNSVSCAGKHFVSDIWRCRKKMVHGSRFVYDYEELLPYNGKIQQALVSYIEKVLDSLGVEYGASHSELKLTERGPVLIETGARLGGLVFPQGINQCTGFNQAKLSILTYLNAPIFEEISQANYCLEKHMLNVLLFSEQEGVVKSLENFEKIKALKSFSGLSLKVKEGDLLRKTVDLTTSPGCVYLVHPDKKQLFDDYSLLKKLMRFVVESTPRLD